MASTKVLLLPLLLVSAVSVVSASHYWAVSATFAYKGNNSDGTYKVRFRHRDTFDGCYSHHRWRCTSGNCGYASGSKITTIDSSNNGPQFDRLWCETETVVTRNVPSDKPFQLRADSCCWISTRNGAVGWDMLTGVDLGKRSDTGEPNKSPDVTTLPFLRIPQNCPRTYKLMTFDPDGDDVRCRYGNLRNIECNRCDRPAGFHLDEDSCTLRYNSATANPRVYAFEMMVEDYSKGHIDLFYSDGSRSHRHPWPRRRNKRAPYYPTTMAWPWWTTARSTTTTWPTTTTTWPTTTTTTPWPTTTTRHTTTTNAWHWWTTARHTTTTTPWPTTTTRHTTTTTPWPTTTTRHTTTTWPPTTWARTITQRPVTPYAPTPPLSQLPLQFSFLVDPPVDSCIEGEYLPKFVYPTPVHGEKIHAEIDSSVEIRVKAQASLSVIQGIIISGPSNVTKHKTTHNEFVIRWTPTADDLGEFFPVCFAVESATGPGVTRPPVVTHSHSHSHSHPTPSSRSGLYHSEMRCVVVEVKEKIVNSHVICNESSMTILVEKASFPRLSEDHLRLNDPSNTICSLQLNSNSTHVIGIIPLNQCGTQIEEDDDYLMFKNEITTYEDPNSVVTRKHLLEVQFYCQYPKHGNVSQSFSVHRKNVTVWEKGMGTFTYGFEFYEDNSYRAMINPNSYPLEVEIGTKLYMKIEATSSINNTEMFVESCRAAPYDNPNYRTPYTIIADGCKVDPTVDIYPRAHNKQFLFSMDAFKFIGLHNQVYISCSVIMCEAGNSNTRCSKGCVNSTSSHRVYKREAVIQSGAHFVSQGPLRLKRSAENSDSPAIALNLNLVFIAGCVLAAVGMICGVIMYKTKSSKVKYQPLPASETL